MERMTKFRVGVFLVLVAAMVFFFGLRAYNVQVVNATVSDNSISTDTYTTAVSAARGQILDRNGNILVSNRASYNLIISGHNMRSGAKFGSTDRFKSREYWQEHKLMYIK